MDITVLLNDTFALLKKHIAAHRTPLEIQHRMVE